MEGPETPADEPNESAWNEEAVEGQMEEIEGGNDEGGDDEGAGGEEDEDD